MKKRKSKSLILFIFIIVLLSGCSFFIYTNKEEKANIVVSDNEDWSTTSRMEVHFLDVGQGDATLIICDGQAMLIDAGDNSKGTMVQNYLRKTNISQLEYVIGTHPDVDHIGGLDVVIYKFECKNILLPDCKKETMAYDSLINVIRRRNYKITRPIVGNSYSLGGAVFTIISPQDKPYGTINDYSIGILLKHGNNKFILVGDAEKASETDMVESEIDLSADVFKIPHHGSKTGVTDDFLAAINPSYALISCGEQNPYGHPSAKVLNKLRKAGISVFRTDEQGTMVAVSDGNSITWNSSPSVSWQAGEPKGSAVNEKSNKIIETGYIINTKTKKFHIPSCSSVEEMAEKNKKISGHGREELILEGFIPCKKCCSDEKDLE